MGYVFCYLSSQGPHLCSVRPFQHPCLLFLCVSVGIHRTCLQRLLLKAVSVPATPPSLRPLFLQGPKQTFGLSGCFCLNSVWYALSFYRFCSTRTELNCTLIISLFSPRYESYMMLLYRYCMFKQNHVPKVLLTGYTICIFISQRQ